MSLLTIGMPTYADYDGVYFTVQALRLYHDMADVELLVVDNYGCDATRQFVESVAGARYVLAPEVVGSAAAKDAVFREARGDVVLCCDCHVLVAPGAIARLREFHRRNPRCADLVQGPLVADDGRVLGTHFAPEWSGQLWGTWQIDPRGLDPGGEPFEIPMQGLGLFACRARDWPGFNAAFRGFGGEEGYLHEKVRRLGNRCLCAPWLRWMHRFGRPAGVPYPLRVQDTLRNYAIGHAELGLDLRPLVRHFAELIPQQEVVGIIEASLGVRWIAD